MDDERWTIDDVVMVYRLSSIVPYNASVTQPCEAEATVFM